MREPVRPEDVCKPAKLDDDVIDRVNLALAKPWTQHERANGRWIDAKVVSYDLHESLMSRFRMAGWLVEYRSDQRDGNSFVFKPRTTRDV